MRVTDVTNREGQHFTAVYQCEHCGHRVEAYGIDTEKFLGMVVPAMVCPECGLTGETAQPRTGVGLC